LCYTTNEKNFIILHLKNPNAPPIALLRKDLVPVLLTTGVKGLMAAAFLNAELPLVIAIA
jgi:hypothetical protein